MMEQAFGNVLRALRKEHKVSQVMLAEHSQLDRTYISLLERGLRQPSLSTVFKIGTALKIAPSEIIRQLESDVSWIKEDF
jgi:transcriptional regulator with XRE-family HTH domain